jgi:hypothetical protein
MEEEWERARWILDIESIEEQLWMEWCLLFCFVGDVGEAEGSGSPHLLGFCIRDAACSTQD